MPFDLIWLSRSIRFWTAPRVGSCRFRGRIFAIGLSGTGTRSLHRALVMLGVKAAQYPEYPDEFDRYQAFLDIPVACRFKTLDVLYPGSKFILTVRDLESWLANRSRKPARSAHLRYWIRENRHLTYGRQSYDRDAYIEAYRKHHAEIEAYFLSRPGDLLKMNIVGGDGWDLLCPFIDAELRKRVDFPNIGNPHSPKATERKPE